VTSPPIQEPGLFQVFSFIVDETGANVTQTYGRNDIGGEYEVLTSWALNGNFVIPALQPRDPIPEVTIVAVRGRGVAFFEPSDDPLFYARQVHTTTLSTGASNTTMMLYTMERPLNVITIQDQVEICSSLTDYCSGWIGPSDLGQWLTTYLPKLMGSHFEKDYNITLDALGMVARLVMHATIYHALLNRGASALQATRQLQAGIQYLVSDQQWRMEAENWFRISLASLQMAPHRMVSTPELDRSRVVDGFGSSWACSSIKS
jgi:hypothetical protein